MVHYPNLFFFSRLSQNNNSLILSTFYSILKRKMGRQPCCEKVGLKKGPWTAEEDKKLITFILTNGQCCWRAVPKLAGLLSFLLLFLSPFFFNNYFFLSFKVYITHTRWNHMVFLHLTVVICNDQWYHYYR